MINKDDQDPIVCYLVVRQSETVKMSTGKLCSQVAHCSAKIISWYYNISINSNPSQCLIFEQWEEAGSRKIVLRADNKEFEKLKEIDDRFVIMDKGLTELSEGTETVIGFFPMRKSEVPKLIKRLQVL